MPTGEAIRTEIGRRLNAFNLFEGAPAYVPVVNTGTSASSVTDATRLAGTAVYGPQAFQGYWVRVSSGARDGEKVRAAMLTPATGVLNLSPSLSGALASGDSVELWHPRLDPDVVDAAIDRALSQICTRWRVVPLTMLADGDMVAQDTSAWTASAATLSKVEKSGQERFQGQTLRVQNSAANGYAAQTLNVRGGETYDLAALVQAATGTAELVVYDLTTASEIPLDATRAVWSGRAFQLLKASFVVPTTCEEVSIRLRGQEANADVYWAWVALMPRDATQVVMPARVAQHSFVGPFYRVVGDDWPELRWYGFPRPDIEDTGGGGYMVTLQPFMSIPLLAWSGALIFWSELANYAPLRSDYHTVAQRAAGDAAETDCPPEYVTWAALSELFPGQFDKQLRTAHLQFGAAPHVTVRRRAKGAFIA